jgi:hypothetical protein
MSYFFGLESNTMKAVVCLMTIFHFDNRFVTESRAGLLGECFRGGRSGKPTGGGRGGTLEKGFAVRCRLPASEAVAGRVGASLGPF